MEHVRQSTKQHAAGSFEVTKNPAFLRWTSNVSSMAAFPIAQLRGEMIPVRNCMNGHDLEKKSPKMFGVGAFRVASTPHQSLSLDVYQTALNQNSRPQRAQDPHHVKVAIDRSTARNQASFLELSTKRIQVAGAFSHLGGSVDDRAVLSLHHGKDPFTPVDIGPVQKKMSMSGQLALLGGRMFQPIFDDPANRAHTVTALSGNLPYAVALNHPTLKPDPLAQLFIESAFPNKSATALPTTKSLFSFRTLPMLSNPCMPTMRTMLFSPSHHPILES